MCMNMRSSARRAATAAVDRRCVPHPGAARPARASCAPGRSREATGPPSTHPRTPPVPSRASSLARQWLIRRLLRDARADPLEGGQPNGGSVHVREPVEVGSNEAILPAADGASPAESIRAPREPRSVQGVDPRLAAWLLARRMAWSSNHSTACVETRSAAIVAAVESFDVVDRADGVQFGVERPELLVVRVEDPDRPEQHGRGLADVRPHPRAASRNCSAGADDAGDGAGKLRRHLPGKPRRAEKPTT